MILEKRKGIWPVQSNGRVRSSKRIQVANVIKIIDFYLLEFCFYRQYRLARYGQSVTVCICLCAAAKAAAFFVQAKKQSAGRQKRSGGLGLLG